jgi:hypothetical protein
MSTPGSLTSAVAKSIAEKLNPEGYDVYYDHEKNGVFTGTIAVSIKDDLSQKDEISQLDIAVIERKSQRAIALIEIEETTDNPKKLIGDIFAILMGNSIFLPGKKKVGLAVDKWTILIIIGNSAGRKKNRNKYIQEKATNAKSVLGTANAKVGDIIIESFSSDADLEKKLMDKIHEAIRRDTAIQIEQQ